MESFNIENFKNLMTTASKYTEAAQKVTPVFQNVPNKIRDIAAKTMNVLEATAKVGFSSLNDLDVAGMKKRVNKTYPFNLNLEEGKADTNMPIAVNWIVKLLKSVIEKLDEQGDIIRVQTEVLASHEEAIDAPKHEIEALKEENEKLKIELDETRQRGMKGNIIVSCPVRNGVTKAVHRVNTNENGAAIKETDTEMVLRLIEEKSNIKIPVNDVVACHTIGNADKHTYVIRIFNRRPGSAWEALTAAMMKSSNMDKQVPVFINFQLTDKRAALAKAVRMAKSEGKLAGYSVDQNGKIKIKIPGGKSYEVIRSEVQLNNFLK